MNDREYKSIIEGLLFLWGDPLETEEIATVLELSKSRTQELLQEMSDEFEHFRRGLTLRRYEDAWQLTTRVEHRQYFEKLLSQPKNFRLTNPAMETLSIIAYKQPVTRVEIDQIRGVQSISSLNTLQDKGYIEEAGRLDAIGRPILYRTTKKFLQHFNLESLDQLPDFEEARIRLEAMEEGETLDLTGQTPQNRSQQEQAENQGRPADEGSLENLAQPATKQAEENSHEEPLVAGPEEESSHAD